METYELHLLSELGNGADGVVYLGRNKITGKDVAIKKLREGDERADELVQDMIWEESVLNVCRHKNIIRMEHRAITTTGKFMVFELMEGDLDSYLASRPEPILETEVKMIMKQILKALAHVHSKGFIHRDIKTRNILINTSNGENLVKIIDFGHTCRVGDNPVDYVGTDRYRSPEVILGGGDYVYGQEVDIWAAGCVFLELLTGEPLFHTKDNPLDWVRIRRIIHWIGPINETTWPGVSELTMYKIFKIFYTPSSDFLKKRLGITSQAAYNLIKRMLCLNPKERITAKQALESDYFEKESRFCSWFC